MENENLDLRTIVAQHQDIALRKQLFGLLSNLYYTPTDSKLIFCQKFFAPEYLPELKELFEKEDNAIVQRAAKGAHFEEFINGNFCLETYLSKDRQFAAIRLLQFSSLQYNPITDVRFFTGAAAQAVCQLTDLK